MFEKAGGNLQILSPTFRAAKTMTEPAQPPAEPQRYSTGDFRLFIFALTKQLDEVEELEDFALLQYELVCEYFSCCIGHSFFYMQLTRPPRYLKAHRQHEAPCSSSASGDVCSYRINCPIRTMDWWTVLERHQIWHVDGCC